MAAVSRVRNPQRLVELVLDTMTREAMRAERVSGLDGSAEEKPLASAEANDDGKRGG